ncbi:MAG: metallopeptidase TldD-related protein [Lachnospiraceae bacterium]|nr:metallopeptidase TldD-related protein [Lachnospiraceae bacterium]
MFDVIKASLQKNDITKYIIIGTDIEEIQLYFIKKTLDMRRLDDTTEYVVKVYTDYEENGKKFTGVASVILQPGMEESVIDRKLAETKASAKCSKQKFFELANKLDDEGFVEMESNLHGTLSDMVLKLTEAVYSEDNRSDVWINSAEFFAKQATRRIITSNGTDVSFGKKTISGEFVTQCEKPMDVETYESFSFTNFDENEIKNMVRRVLDTSVDRAKAKGSVKSGNYRVILSGKHIPVFFNYFTEKSNGAYLYLGMSDWKKGTETQGENVTGDRINVKYLPDVPFTGDGIKLVERDFIKDGKLETVAVGQQYAYYMGIEATGDYNKLKVDCGTRSFEDMKKEPYLYIVNFSDVQTDTFSGVMSGEIRLGYYFDGKTVVPVSGGSMSINLLEEVGKIVLSKESQSRDNFEGPLAIAFENVSIAGE